MRYSQKIGVVAALALIGSCFLNWAWYPDLNMHFTGFYTYKNYYGKPGKLLVILSILSLALFLVPRVWAKRWNLLVNAIAISYAIFSFITFTRCYAASICPQKEAGLFLMMGSAAVMLVMALLPDGQIKKDQSSS
ncbi:MAG: hypothetical protein RL732_1489 [Bacteroidota bacterium]